MRLPSGSVEKPPEFSISGVDSTMPTSCPGCANGAVVAPTAAGYSRRAAVGHPRLHFAADAGVASEISPAITSPARLAEFLDTHLIHTAHTPPMGRPVGTLRRSPSAAQRADEPSQICLPAPSRAPPAPPGP